MSAGLIAEQGFPQYTAEYILENFMGLKFSEMIKRIGEETGHQFPQDFGKTYMNQVRKHMHGRVKAVEHAQETVKFAASHAKLAVVSNGEHENTLDKIQFLGLCEYFSEDLNVVTGLMPPNPKPAPDCCGL